ncbi:cytochrome c3 family protein [Bacillaceae bacterium IKA-2]|nr:cytochrome c3 family protein [Bacillaceae bacterium IKA-2]
MLKKGDIKKALILFICFLFVFPINSQFPTSTVLGENVNNDPTVNITEKDKEIKEDGNADAEIKVIDDVKIDTETEVKEDTELDKAKDTKAEEIKKLEIAELKISVLEPIGESPFNVTELKIGIVNQNKEDLTKLLVKKSKNGEDLDEISIDPFSTEKIISKLKDGNYSVQIIAVTIDNEEIHSNTIEFEIITTEPEIEIITPSDEFSNSAIISGQTDRDLQLSVIVGEETIHPEDEEDLDFSYDEDGYFSFDLTTKIAENEMVEVTITAEDAAGNIGETSIEFFYDISRPFIPPSSLYPKPYMTQVPVEGLEVSFKIVDDNIDIKEIIEKRPIALLDHKGEIPGVINYNEKTKTFTFVPDQSKLSSYQKYYVLINPLLADKAGNYIHPRSWSFTTTKKNSSFSIMSTNGTSTNSPHGNYLMNTNTCKTCHNTHGGTGPKLEGPDDELKEKLEQHDHVVSYCMACHDGTVASKMPENTDQHAVSNHNKQLTTKDGQVVNQSCGSCHNVHLDSHEKNPNLKKDHITFNHTGVSGAGSLGLISSSQRLCESCHASNLQEIYLSQGVKYQVFPYRDRNTSIEDLEEGKTTFGEFDDYLLCLRCHNSNFKADYQNIVDIDTHYKADYSGHYITNDRVQDGSLLDGNLPCADCHETHGSANNVGLLKDSLGHRNPTEFKQSGEWTIADERRFCESCHNNDTELYGITVEYDGHENPNQSCSTCHGGGNFIKAVHAPTEG